MKRKIFFILIPAIIFLLIIITILYFYKTQVPKTDTKCPEDYPNTNIGLETKTRAVNEWTTDFSKNNPNASLTDFAKARYRFYVENKCDTTLENYYESEDSESDTEEEKIMRATIKSEIDDQAMKNLIEGLKNQ